MKTRIVLLTALLLLTAGCKFLRGPDRKGEFRLSSEGILGGSTYHWVGYSYEDSEYYRYPFEQDPLPDLINLGFRIIGGSGQSTLPGFNTPGSMNGFALVGDFGSQKEAEDFFKDYREAANDLQYEVDSDTVELHQVWVQKTSLGNYAKLLVKDIESFEGEGETKYNEVLCEYIYQPNGSREFPK